MAADPGGSAMTEHGSEDDRHDRARRCYTQLLIQSYTIHFKNLGYMRDATMDMLDKRVCDEILLATTNHRRARSVLGADPKFWSELLVLFRAATPSIESRSFSVYDPPQMDYESASSILIATHYPTLSKDLDRLIDIVTIARNVVTHSTLAQDLAAESLIEDEMFRLVNCCVRVTARGYDGDSGTGDEEKWQWIVGAYKKLLIVSLQFINNLVAQNERRKLMLWVSLFDNFDYTDPATSLDSNGRLEPGLAMPEPPVSTGDILVALGETSRTKVDAAADALRAKRLLAPRGQPRPSRPVSGYVLFVKEHSPEVRKEIGPSALPTDLAMELSQRWAKEPEEVRRDFSLRYDELMTQYDKDLEEYNEARKTKAAEKSQIDQVAIRIATIEAQLNQSMKKDVPHVAPLDLPLVTDPNVRQVPLSLEEQEITSGDHDMISAEEGSRILEKGKADLLRRLHDNEPEPLHVEHAQGHRSPPSHRTYGEHLTAPESVRLHHSSVPEELADAESEAEESGDEEYSSSNEDGGGLLTDVPLILGPSEIEVLPMIIMSGIVPPAKLPIDHQQDYDAVVNMHTVRCHLLLAQDTGKNLLRELLIFVAAWDLRDEELYFKFMLKIMEAILVNGLMPYAYHAFRDRSSSKDIISPAQAVIMKLLTSIFRSRAEVARLAVDNPDAPRYPARVDVHIVAFIFAEFRQNIIPQTCALIFLQGKIHQNLASPEAFPLNLWDMERMYEGVYQYLEFFAVLTEEQTWKDVMADWEVSSELVTMLRELEVAISKSNGATAQGMPNSRPQAVSEGQSGHLDDDSPPPPPRQAGTVSEPATPAAEFPAESAPLEGEMPLAYTEEPQDEPSDFEWRNLKKLTVLVLSSLIWKNKKVQDQVREYGGLEALVGCCKHDEHNPYIREHAIMCLRFAVEANAENAEVIRNMAGPSPHEASLPSQAKHSHSPTPVLHAAAADATSGGAEISFDAGDAPFISTPPSTIPASSAQPQIQNQDQIRPQTPTCGAVVPKEVLDTQCYETFMDKQGQVGLRRKQQVSVQVHQPSGGGGNESVVATTSPGAPPSSAPRSPTTAPAIPNSSHPDPPSVLSMQAATVQAIQAATMQAIQGAMTSGLGDLITESDGSGAETGARTGADADALAAAAAGSHKLALKHAADRAAEIMRSALRDLPANADAGAGAEATTTVTAISTTAGSSAEERDVVLELNRRAAEISAQWNGTQR